MKRNGYTSVDGDQPHAHSFEFDEYGNGTTLETLSKPGGSPPHTHRIANKKVSPGGYDGHTHILNAGQFGSAQPI